MLVVVVFRASASGTAIESWNVGNPPLPISKHASCSVQTGTDDPKTLNPNKAGNTHEPDKDFLELLVPCCQRKACLSARAIREVLYLGGPEVAHQDTRRIPGMCCSCDSKWVALWLPCRNHPSPGSGEKRGTLTPLQKKRKKDTGGLGSKGRCSHPKLSSSCAATD